MELSQVKIKTLEDAQQMLKQKLKEAECKTMAAEESLQREQSSQSLGDLQHTPTENTQRPHSPAVSAGVNSLEDGMGGSIDWHQVSCMALNLLTSSFFNRNRYLQWIYKE